ncbi:MAG: hypothetical protein PHW13_07855 [Methylococcales bacterium]|nr:hypothetical protein [Methylococcales bacterium]
MKMNFWTPVLAAGLVAGCASMDRGSTQQFMVFTHDDLNIRQTLCNISNEEGDWSVAPIAPITINRDGNPMSIRCENETQAGFKQIEPMFYDKYVFQDLMLDLCFPACIVDGYNNAFYQYPTHISVDMKPKQ